MAQQTGTDLVKRDAAELADHSTHTPAVGPGISYNPDAPSEAWGWHGQWSLFANKGSKVLLGIFTAVMFLMLFGNHVSNVENYWLIVIGIGMVVWIVVRERAARRTRHASHRKPPAQSGH